LAPIHPPPSGRLFGPSNVLSVIIHPGMKALFVSVQLSHPAMALAYSPGIWRLFYKSHCTRKLFSPNHRLAVKARRWTNCQRYLPFTFIQIEMILIGNCFNDSIQT
jgi:hypothetical protein